MDLLRFSGDECGVDSDEGDEEGPTFFINWFQVSSEPTAATLESTASVGYLV